MLRKFMLEVLVLIGLISEVLMLRGSMPGVTHV
jgi:hypothetical protein